MTRVAVLASDPEGEQRLATLVAEAGHEVAALEDADVALLRGEAPPLRVPALSLGPAAGDTAGVLPSEATTAQLDAALRAVAAGLVVRPPAREPGFGMLGDVPAVLTPRELEILALIGDGHSNKAAARRLGISQHTVKFHLEAVFAKLGVRTRAEAVARGLRRGLVEL